MTTEKQVHPAILCVLDGFGLSYKKQANAIFMAKTPHLDELMARYPMTTLEASGEEVGLEPGQMGDSNVGHLNLGAGRIVYQELVRINKSIESGEFFAKEALQEALRRAAQPGATLHLLGLCSDGGVHSHINHLFAALQAARNAGVTSVAIHALLDGRDVPPTSAGTYLQAIEGKAEEIGVGRIASIIGRYFAMDRDNRWDRVEQAYRAMVRGQGSGGTARTAMEALQAAYAAGETDEFVKPCVIVDTAGQPLAPVRDGDVVFFLNFRADRARQLTRALTQPDFDAFDRGAAPAIHFLGMQVYDETFGLPSMFQPQLLQETLGQIVAEHGLRQFRLAETEKYAHVTFFFNGGEDKVFPGEDRLLIPSPKVATYDLKPEMSAPEVADAAVEAIRSGQYGLIVMNFANPDMVGHSGKIEAAIKAIEAVDAGVGKIAAAAREAGMALMIVADHGNCDQMVDYQTGEPHTNHTTNPVPAILVDDRFVGRRMRPGVLADVAPTLLEVMGLPQPPEMTRSSLLV